MVDVDKTMPIQGQQTGLTILVREMGSTELVRFLQQLELGSGDYTAEREQWLGG